MSFDPGGTTNIERLLELLNAGDPQAVELLIRDTHGRLRQLAHVMLRGYPKVQALHETDDVLQNALIKLERALRSVQPGSAKEYIGLAALQLNRVLLDMAKSAARKPVVELPPEVAVAAAPSTGLPTEDWTAFHECAYRLPDPPRGAFFLSYYSGYGNAEIAAHLEASPKSIQRQVRRAKLLVMDCLRDGGNLSTGFPPESPREPE